MNSTRPFGDVRQVGQQILGGCANRRRCLTCVHFSRNDVANVSWPNPRGTNNRRGCGERFAFADWRPVDGDFSIAAITSRWPTTSVPSDADAISRRDSLGGRGGPSPAGGGGPLRPPGGRFCSRIAAGPDPAARFSRKDRGGPDFPVGPISRWAGRFLRRSGSDCW